MIHFQDERDVDRYVETLLTSIGLELKTHFNDQRNMSNYMKAALKGSSKTENKTGIGIPDFTIEKYNVPVIIENKVDIKKLQKLTKDGISRSAKDVAGFAVNGAVSYARHMIHSGKYDNVIAIGIAGDSSENLRIVIHYVFGFEGEPKLMEAYTALNFLENDYSFEKFVRDATLTEAEKHRILIKTQEELRTHADKLSILMNSHSIGVAERVLYVSGMLLSMQDIKDDNNDIILEGLAPKNIMGKQPENHRDGIKIITQIDDYLTAKNVPLNKKRLMIASFNRISIDADRDKPTDLSPLVSKSIEKQASTTRQIFQYVYDNIFEKIEGTAGHLDILGEMYSIFLKYALGDGKEIGIVLTPPYITKLMAQLLDINKNSKVLDVATGSAGFLISSMELMVEQVNNEYGKGTTAANKKISEIKNIQLMGIEKDPHMYTLAATNMIMRGDGSAKIEKGSSFDQPKELYENFGATALLLNPPFTYQENGMPFFAFGLRYMQKGGKAAIIIQDSAGNGKAIKSNKEILQNNRLIASIKMPVDLFEPYASVQTSIYVFEAGVPHNFATHIVKFIDFRQDGYKRAKRRLYEIDHPTERYADMPLIYEMGLNASIHPSFNTELWNLTEIYVEDTITDSGEDWNFEYHKKIDTRPTVDDFRKTVSEYMAWEVGQIIKNGRVTCQKHLDCTLTSNDEKTISHVPNWKEFRVGDLFEIRPTKNYGMTNEDLFKSKGNTPVLSNTSVANGISGYVDLSPTEKGNIITFSDTTTADTIFYQPNDFVGYSHVQGMYPLKHAHLLNECSYLFIVAAFKKATIGLYNYGSKFNRKTARETVIKLPANNNGVPDFAYMDDFIKVQQKLVMAPLVYKFVNTVST